MSTYDLQHWDPIHVALFHASIVSMTFSVLYLEYTGSLESHIISGSYFFLLSFPNRSPSIKRSALMKPFHLDMSAPTHSLCSVKLWFSVLFYILQEDFLILIK